MEIKEKTIGKNTFYVRPFPPLDALRLLGDLQAVVTGSMGDSISGDGELLDKEINIGAVIANVGGKLTGDKLIGFAERILREDYVSVRMYGEDSPSKLDVIKCEEVFTGRTKDMIAVMFFVLEVNYSDFFDLLPKGFGVPKTLKKQ